METLNLTHFKVASNYQKAGFNVQFGGGYQSTAQADHAPIWTPTITVSGMRYYTDPNGDVITTGNEGTNIKLLDTFWRDHEQWKSFQFTTGEQGLKVFKFAEPLQFETPITGGSGLIPPFQLHLVEQLV